MVMTRSGEDERRRHFGDGVTKREVGIRRGRFGTRRDVLGKARELTSEEIDSNEQWPVLGKMVLRRLGDLRGTSMGARHRTSQRELDGEDGSDEGAKTTMNFGCWRLQQQNSTRWE